MSAILKIGLGGGCHWCTEAVFQQIQGVINVEQGYIASVNDEALFSEGVIVHYDSTQITLRALINVHLQTHEATKDHSFRKKYRSAIYYFSSEQASEASRILEAKESILKEKIITQILPFENFKTSRESIQNYYLKNPEAPFCKRYIVPKLKKIPNNIRKIIIT